MQKDVISGGKGILTRAIIKSSKSRAERCPCKRIFTRIVKCDGSGLKAANLRSMRGFRLLASGTFFLRGLRGRFDRGGGQKSAIMAALSTGLRRTTCSTLKSGGNTTVMVRTDAKGVLTVISGPTCSPGGVLDS